MSPAAVAARPSLRLGALDDAERLCLERGLRVALAEDRTVPLFHCQWILPAGARHDPAGLEGLNALALPLVTGGTDARTGRRADGFDALGADLLSYTGWDDATVAIELSAHDWRAAIEWGESLFSRPSPSPAAVAAERGRRIARQGIAVRRPAAQADRWWHRLAYPRSRFGQPLDGTEASLERIEHRHVEAVADRFRSPLWFIAVGCVSREQLVARLAESALPTRGEAPAMPLPESPAATPGGTYHLVTPPSTQAEIRVGHASVCRTHAAFAGLQLLSQLLGTRLAGVLRDRSGASYRTSVRLEPGTGSSPLIVAATVEASQVGETLERIASEVERLRDEPVPESELQVAKEIFAIDFLCALQGLPGLAAKLKRLAVNGHPANYYQNQLAEVRALSVRDLQALARHHVHRERLLEVVAGPPLALSPWRAAVVPLADVDTDRMNSSEGEYR